MVLKWIAASLTRPGTPSWPQWARKILIEVRDGAHITETGLHASAECDLRWEKGENESVRELALRRIAFAYGGVFGEASFACIQEDLDRCAQGFYEADIGTKGDAEKIRAIREWAAGRGLSKEELFTLNSDAWGTARSTIQTHRAALIRIAKLFQEKAHLSDSEIRDCLVNLSEAEAA